MTFFRYLSAVVVVLISLSDSLANDSEVDANVIRYFHSILDGDSYEVSRDYALQILKVGRRENDSNVQARGLVRLAFIDVFHGKLDSDWKDNLEETSQLIKVETSIASAELRLFRGYIRGNWENEYSESLEDLCEAIRISNLLRDDYLQFFSHAFASKVQTSVENFDQAKTHAFRALAIARFLKDDKLVGLALYRVVHVLDAADQRALAFEYAKELLEMSPSSCVVLFLSKLNGGDEYSKLSERLVASLDDKNKVSNKTMHAAIKQQWAERLCQQGKYNAALLAIREAEEIYLQSGMAKQAIQAKALRLKVSYLKNPSEEKVAEFADFVQQEDQFFRKQLILPPKELADYFDAFGDSEKALEWRKLSLKRSQALALAEVDGSRIAEAKNWQAEIRNRDYKDSLAAQRKNYHRNMLAITVLSGLLCLISTSMLTVFYFSKRSRTRLERIVQERTQELQHAKDRAEASLATRQRFLAKVNHELRNPLTAIVGFCGLLKDSTQYGTEFLEHCESHINGLDRSSQQMLKLVDSVLDVEKIQDSSFRTSSNEFSLSDVCNSVYEMLKEKAESKNLRFSCKAIESSDPTYLVGDDLAISQVIINLALNAITYTDSGFVKVIAALNTASDSCDLVITVEDSGRGIPQEFHCEIFEPFTEIPGSSGQSKGLGLYITQSLIKKLNGTIELESKLNFGTKFDVQIPVALANMTSCENDHFENTTPFVKTTERVLIVDDQLMIRQTLVAQLQTLGHECQSTDDLHEVLCIVDNWKPDIVLMDLRMPGLSGFEMTQTILSNCEYRPAIVAMTGDATREIADRVGNFGFAGLLVKPFRMQQLFDVLELSKS